MRLSDKLSNLRYRWQIIAVTILVNCFAWLAKFSRSRAHIHWIGRYRRRRRPERFIFSLLFASGVLFLKPPQIATWSVFLGGMAAIFLNLYTVYRFIPRKWAHWVKT